MKKYVYTLGVVIILVFLYTRQNAKKNICKILQIPYISQNLIKSHFMEIGQQNNSDWVAHFNSNARQVLVNNYNDSTTFFPINLVHLDEIIDNSSHVVKFIFVFENNKMGLVILESVTNKYFKVNTQNGNLSEIDATTFHTLQSNYLQSVKNNLNVPTTLNGQTEFTFCPASDIKNALNAVDMTKAAQYNLAQITETDYSNLPSPADTIMANLITIAPNNLTLILQAKTNTNVTKYFDLSELSPPNYPN